VIATEADSFFFGFWDEEWVEDFKQHTCKRFIGKMSAFASS